MKALCWIMSFSLAVTMIAALMLGYISSLEGKIICGALSVILLRNSWVVAHEDYREFNEEIKNKIKN